MNLPFLVFTFNSGFGLMIPSGYETWRKSSMVFAAAKPDGCLGATKGTRPDDGVGKAVERE